jgi:hypothetical protein
MSSGLADDLFHSAAEYGFFFSRLPGLARISHRIFYTSEGSEGKWLMTSGIGGRRWPERGKQSVNGTNWRMAGSDSLFCLLCQTS